MAIDLYLMLKIPRNARVEVIDQAIKTAWTYGHLPSKMLVTAQRVLLNPAMRKEYDRRLAEVHKTVAPPAPATHELVFAASGAVNPYPSPRTRVDHAATDEQLADGKLFSVTGIGIATLFGSLPAGGILLFLNYRRLGHSRAANLTLFFCIVLHALYSIGCYFLPDHIAALIFAILGPLAGMILYAHFVQNGLIKAHQAAGGEMASNWLALGIGLLTLVAEIVVVIALLLVFALSAVSLLTL